MIDFYVKRTSTCILIVELSVSDLLTALNYKIKLENRKMQLCKIFKLRANRAIYLGLIYLLV